MLGGVAGYGTLHLPTSSSGTGLQSRLFCVDSSFSLLNFFPKVALTAKSMGKPVLVCCQTFKFTERVQTDR